MKKLCKVAIPVDSTIYKYLPMDYIDAYACKIAESEIIDSAEVMIDLWTDAPKWVNALFKLRNVLIRPFGLKTDNNHRKTEELKQMIRSGKGNNGLMFVESRTLKETVLILKDDHLDAYMSTIVEGDETCQQVIIVTLVRYHKLLGKFYFFFVRPFHKMVVRGVLRKIYCKYSKS